MPDETITRELDQIGRRLDAYDQRLNTIDLQGTRGLAGLVVQMSELSKDIGKLENELKRVTAARWQGWVAFIVALLPVYIFIVEQLISR